MLCYIPLLGENFTYMDKFNKEEYDKMAQDLVGRFMEIGQFMEEHHFPNKLVMNYFAVAIALLLTPPKGTEKIFADSFRKKILQALNDMDDLRKALGHKEN